VNRNTSIIPLAAVAAALLSGPLQAADDATAISDTKDLTAVIALQGLPCGEVVSAREQGENDFIATCKNGLRYRVSVNAEGRVVVEKK
jgi:hypothetical protein